LFGHRARRGESFGEGNNKQAETETKKFVRVLPVFGGPQRALFCHEKAYNVSNGMTETRELNRSGLNWRKKKMTLGSEKRY